MLSHKLAMLMALANADRCSDLVALDLDYHTFQQNGVRFVILGPSSGGILPIVPGRNQTLPSHHIEMLRGKIKKPQENNSEEHIVHLCLKTTQTGHPCYNRPLAEKHHEIGRNRHQHFYCAFN